MTLRQPPIDAPGAEPPADTVPTVDAFLADADTAAEGWSRRYGGPDGVVQITGELLELLAEQSRLVAAVRTGALRELLRTESGAAIASRHHISKQAVHKAASAPRAWNGESW